MYQIIKFEKDKLKTIFENASKILNLRPVVIEKDFWITLILDYLFNKSIYKNYFVFKGGTCLSKCYKTIDRFSEDIDIVLDWSLIGLTSQIAFQQRSSKKRNKFVEDARNRTLEFFKDKLIPSMRNDFVQFNDLNIKIYLNPETNRDVIFQYPNLFNDDFIKTQIKLEIGCFSAIKPTNNVTISSYLYECFPKLFKVGYTNVKCVTVESIFWEKLLILYQNAKKSKIRSRESRHYYDLASLYNSKYKESAFKHKELLEQALLITRYFYYSETIKDNIDFKDLQLIPCNSIIKSLEDDYSKMQGMIFDKKFEFNQILIIINQLQNELRAI